MKTRRTSRWFWSALFAVFLSALFVSNHAMTRSQVPAQKPDVKTSGGLTTVTFYLEQGELKVNLPDDIRAGDTISGTVLAEPKGQTKEERAKNQSVLNGLVLEIDGKRVQPFSGNPEKEREAVIQQTFWIYTADLPKSAAQSKPGDVTSRPVPISVGDGEKDLAQASILIWQMFDEIRKMAPPTHPSGAVITPDPKITPTPGMTPSGPVITPDPKITPTFIIPPLGQTGRPVVITGPFDGDSSNTILNFVPHFPAPQIHQSDLEYEKEIARGSLDFGAESPRKAVFNAPTHVTGPIDIKLKEGNVETKGTYRNVGVNLSAPKTNLLKGEKTELKVEVNGLQGLKEPVPLILECKGVITMEGGIYQPLVIQPSEVGADGRYTTTRGITGVQTGGWTAKATVVTHRFNVCLQDDTAPARRILWNTVTGEYVFTYPDWWPPKGKEGGTGGTTGESGGGKTGGTTPPADPNNPPGGLTGQGKMIMKGCIITLEHNAPDRRVFSKLDSCTTSGTSTVEDPKTKVKFTITDRNIADNTCQSQ